MDTKTIKLEYLYLDNQTCTRCRETEKQLDATLDDLGLLLKTAGYNVSLEKIKMDSKQKAVEYQFTKSPTIRVNNADIGFEQTENRCSDCGELCGCGEETTCRTWLFNEKEYEVPPKELLADRILQTIYGGSPSMNREFQLPRNLEKFYIGVKNETKKECCDSTCCS